jgi:hypothetical protein
VALWPLNLHSSIVAVLPNIEDGSSREYLSQSQEKFQYNQHQYNQHQYNQHQYNQHRHRLNQPNQQPLAHSSWSSCNPNPNCKTVN